MAARFARLDIQGFLARPNASKELVSLESELMAEEVGSFGAERMRIYIAERGTPFSAAARKAGINSGLGRFRTGNMYNSVDYRVEAGQKTVRSAFGWIRNFEQYFIYQEEGFKNIFIASYDASGNLRRGPNTPVSNGPIVRKNPFGGYKNTPGMFALRDARADVEAQMPAFLKKYKSRITRSLNSI